MFNVALKFINKDQLLINTWLKVYKISHINT